MILIWRVLLKYLIWAGGGDAAVISSLHHDVPFSKYNSDSDCMNIYHTIRYHITRYAFSILNQVAVSTP